MRSLRFLLALVLAIVLVQSRAWSILFETPSGQRVGGYLVKEEGGKLTIRVKLPDGKTKEETHDRAKIKILYQVPRGGLEKLSKDNPKAYSNLAEDLAEKKADPEARETALRLYLIAAYLDPEKLGRGSLVAMSGLALHPTEARKYRAMAFLLDPKHDPTLLKVEAPRPPSSNPQVKTQDAAVDDFLKALRAFRKGKLDEAKQRAGGKEVIPLFAAIPGLMDHASFLAACKESKCLTCKGTKKIPCPECKGMGKTKSPVFGVQKCPDCEGKGNLTCNKCAGTGLGQGCSDEQLAAIIKAELWAVDQVLGPDVTVKKGSSDGKWTGLLQSKTRTPIPLLSLETITEFDPRKCHFRDGEWVEP